MEHWTFIVYLSHPWAKQYFYKKNGPKIRLFLKFQNNKITKIYILWFIIFISKILLSENTYISGDKNALHGYLGQ